jgi:very-short-patch-repair endonuclease
MADFIIKNKHDAKRYVKYMTKKSTKRKRVKYKNKSRVINLPKNKVSFIIDQSNRRAEQLRNNATPEELKLKEYLENNNIYHKFQEPIYKKNGGYYIADFYFPNKRIIVELDGYYHSLYENIIYDKQRDEEIRRLKIKTVRITNDKFKDFNKVISILNKYKLI